MRAVYRLEVQGTPQDPAAEPVVQLDAITIDGVRVELATEGPNNRLAGVTLSISGAPVRIDPADGIILTVDPEIEARAFLAASFVANVLREETGFDGIDPAAIVGTSPEVSPETPEEEAQFRGRARRQQRSVRTSAAIRVLLSREAWERWGSLGASAMARAALATYCEGLRAQSPFLKFEQFYKVIEHFFPGLDGRTGLDRAVAQHLAQTAPDFTEARVRQLRELRNRSMHPHVRSAPGPHASPQRLGDLREVLQEWPTMQSLARHLLRHPPL